MPVSAPVPVPALRVIATLLLVACSPEAPAKQPPSAEPAPSFEAPVEPAPAPSSPTGVAPPALTTDDCSALDMFQHDVAPSAVLPRADYYLRVEPERTCKLFRAPDLVLQLHGPAQAQAMPHGQLAVLLRNGIAYVDLAPGAATADSGFWLGTPSGRIDMVQGARVVVSAHLSGATQLYVVSGQVRVQPVGGGEAVRDLGAGQGLTISHRGQAAPLKIRLDRVEDALAWMRKAPMLSLPEGQRFEGLEALLTVSDQTRGLVKGAEARLEALARDHEQRVAAGGAGAMDLQRQIATESGALLASQRLLSAQDAALEAWTLLINPPGRAGALELLGR